MQTNPKENHVYLPVILIEEFRRKGYKCQEIKEENATIFIMTHEKKSTDPLLQILNESNRHTPKAN